MKGSIKYIQVDTQVEVTCRSRVATEPKPKLMFTTPNFSFTRSRTSASPASVHLASKNNGNIIKSDP